MKISEVINYLAKKGITGEIKTDYHIQVKNGQFIFNIYPSKQTIYINGATSGTFFSNYQELLDFIMLKPKNSVSDKRSFRKTSYKATRKLLWSDYKKRFCFVCGKIIDKFEDSSLEHKIPLGLGGSNRLDNFALSHKECNKNRGCSL